MNKKQFIKKNMEEKMQWLKENTNHQVAIMFLQGSQNYGMDNYSEEYTSDFDMKCFIVPTLEDLIENKKMESYTIKMEDESQIEIKDIRLLGQLITKMNPTYLELLYTPYYLINKDFQRVPTTLLYNQLKKMRDELSNADVARLLKAMNGFVSQKYKDIEKDTEASHHFIEEYKYNPKQFHHLMRLSYMIDRIIRLQGKIDFYELMTLEFLTKSQKKQLKNYKTSPIDYVDAMKIATEHQLKNRELIDTFLNKQQCPKNQEILDTLETKINDYVLLCIKKEVIKSIKQHNTKNK